MFLWCWLCKGCSHILLVLNLSVQAFNIDSVNRNVLSNMPPPPDVPETPAWLLAQGPHCWPHGVDVDDIWHAHCEQPCSGKRVQIWALPLTPHWGPLTGSPFSSLNLNFAYPQQRGWTRGLPYPPQLCFSTPLWLATRCFQADRL